MHNDWKVRFLERTVSEISPKQHPDSLGASNFALRNIKFRISLSVHFGTLKKKLCVPQKKQKTKKETQKILQQRLCNFRPCRNTLSVESDTGLGSDYLQARLLSSSWLALPSAQRMLSTSLPLSLPLAFCLAKESTGTILTTRQTQCAIPLTLYGCHHVDNSFVSPEW